MRILQWVLSWDWPYILGFLIALPFLLTSAVTTIVAYYELRTARYRVNPPRAPYAVPYFGNTFEYLFAPRKFMGVLTKIYGDIPVRLKVGPYYAYFVSGRENIQKLFSNSRDLSTKAFMCWAMVHVFGMPDADFQAYWSDDSGLHAKPHPNSNVKPEDRMFHLQHHNFSANLKGAALDELSRQFIRALGEQIAEMEKQLDGDECIEVPDGFEYIVSRTFRAASTALYGPHLLEMNPTFEKDFWEFESWFPTIFKNYPRWIVSRPQAVLSSLLRQVAKWQERAAATFDWGDEEKKGVLWEPNFGTRLMRSSWETQRDTNWKLSPTGKASYDLGFIWAANANSIPAAAWSLMHVIGDPSLTRRIRSEIAPAFSSSSPESVDLALLSKCPLLQSVFAEVVRIRGAFLVNRMSTVPDFKLGTWALKPGYNILGCTYFSHRDENVWNAGRTRADGTQEHPLDDFWAERFLSYPNDPSSGPLKKHHAKSTTSSPAAIIHDDKEAKYTTEGLNGVYFPFGGGLKQCPGKFFAHQEIFLLVAMMLHVFDFEMRDLGKWRETRNDMEGFSVRIMHPDRKNAVRIRRRQI